VLHAEWRRPLRRAEIARGELGLGSRFDGRGIRAKVTRRRYQQGEAREGSEAAHDGHDGDDRRTGPECGDDRTDFRGYRSPP